LKGPRNIFLLTLSLTRTAIGGQAPYLSFKLAWLGFMEIPLLNGLRHLQRRQVRFTLVLGENFMKLIFMLFAYIVAVGNICHAETVDRDGIVRDDYGQVLSMGQLAAIETCAKFGMRLPSVRELATFAKSDGEILKEVNEVTPDDIAKGYVHLVGAIDSDGKRDSFYYDYRNYLIPVNDLGQYWFWSSSHNANTGNPYGGYPIVFGVGMAEYYDSGYDVAVRCIAGH
jgi:hypothetical protein